jgi:cytochrome c biogenesis factor
MWGLTMWLALGAVAWLLWKPTYHEKAPRRAFFLHGLLVLPFATLAGLFIANDASVLHVAAFGGEALPLKYRFAATWAAREGPLLMWMGWMALLAWWWRKALPGEEAFGQHAQRWRLRAVHLMTLTLLLVAFSLDPFKPTPAFFRGAGLNPLLQTDLMVIHPPLIFLAYSFCLHLTAIALAAAYTHQSAALAERMLRVARPGLLVATLGIGLGGLWAYLILDWGGYWAWDPVETGSFLPWLALVMLVHLRTRPGTVEDRVWIGAGLVTGVLALFATTVTRAGGVWASSVHTFVASDSSTPPDDVFGRLMVLRGDEAATEVMTYVVWMFMLIGCWLAVARREKSDRPLPSTAAWSATLPAWTALIGCLFFTSGDGASLSWTTVPQVVFVSVLVVPLLLVRPFKSVEETGENQTWAYHARFPVPLDAVYPLLVYGLTGDVFIATAMAVLFVPLYRSNDALKAWPWAAAGVMLGLSLAWSQLLSIAVAGVLLVMFVLPWLVAPQDGEGRPLEMKKRRGQQTVALWSSVVLVSLYLVLSWTLLLASIDAVNFEAHELYGAPFIAGLGGALFLYARRKDSSSTNLVLLSGATALSVAGFVLAPQAFGRDAGTMVSEHLTRGHLVWMTFPLLTLATAPIAREVVRQMQTAREKGTWKRIPFGAHVVHLGLLLLLLGHLSTTVLVDRGDAAHRISLVKDEVIVHEGFGLVFEELVLESEGLEVGDGFIGVRIGIFEVNNGEVGDRLGEVLPGTLRFDAQGTPRSEVDTLTRLTGDLVFIFDGSQAGGLMATAQSGSLSDVEVVRVTVYNLPHAHTVWLGWGVMMLGMATVTWAGTDAASRKGTKEDSKLEEE